MHEGYVSAVKLDKGFGFIAAPNQPDIFFHVRDLVDLEFDETLRGRRVRFEIASTAKGNRAVDVRAAN